MEERKEGRGKDQIMYPMLLERKARTVQQCTYLWPSVLTCVYDC